MYTERRRKQLEKEGVNVELVEETAKNFVKAIKEAGMTIQEGILVVKKMDCIFSEMTRCNPNTKIK